MVLEYWLNYVGRGLYTIDIFVKEAYKYGVNRAIPHNLLHQLEWGTPILLAQYNRKNRSAFIFGYFIFSTITTNLDDDTIDEVLKELKVVKIKKHDNPKKSTIHRMCGSYTLSRTIELKSTPREIIEKMKEKAKGKFKIFIGGKFYGLKPFTVSPIGFTRGLMKIELDKEIFFDTISPKTLLKQIKEYQQRTYLPKKSKKSFPLHLVI